MSTPTAELQQRYETSARNDLFATLATMNKVMLGAIARNDLTALEYALVVMLGHVRETRRQIDVPAA